MFRSQPLLLLLITLACTTSGCMGIMGGGGLLHSTFPDCVDTCGQDPGIGNGGLIDQFRAHRIQKLQAHRDRMSGCRNCYAHQVSAPVGDCGSRMMDCGSSVMDCGSNFIDCGSSHCGMPLNCGMPMTMGSNVVYDGMEMDGQMMGGGPYFDGMNSGSDCPTCQDQGSFSGMMGGQMEYGQPMMHGHQQSTMMPTPAYQMDAPAPPSSNPTPARPMAPHDPNAKDEYLAPRIGPQSNMYHQNGMQSYSGMMPQQQMMMQPQVMQQQMMPQHMMQGGMVQGNMMQGTVMQTSGMMTQQMMPQQVPQQMMQPMQYQPQYQMQQQMNYPVQQSAGVPAIQAF